MLRAGSGEKAATQVLTIMHPFARVAKGVKRLPKALSDDLEIFVTKRRVKRFRAGRRFRFFFHRENGRSKAMPSALNGVTTL